MYAERLRETLPAVRERIARARERAGSGREVALVAVTKGHPAEAVCAAIDAGLHEIGENRVHELESKISALGRAAARWHLIGHLQRNKVRRALPLFDVLQSVDSLRLARELSKEAVRSARRVSMLVQINTSGEASKGGFEDRAVDAVARIAELEALGVAGLMTMAPLTGDEATLRGCFAAARRIFEQCAARVDGFEPKYLSMGMSNDFEIAIEEGSTMVRLGTVLFGERER
ncbi:MAG: YggS family pyridoxal phosphate-dependent enzyme [Longimicrobiales bacterium]